jgi:RHS repeat-associated protein
LADPYGYKAQFGYYTDSETGLQILTFRYYDAALGRFLTRDPIGFEGGVNLYGYVNNNPLNNVDPLGLDGLKLPNGPSGLPPEWKPDPTHPHGQRFRHPGGDILDFHPRNPLKSPKTHGGKDHWHHNKGKKHLYPGDEIPDPNGNCEPQPEKPEPIPFVPILPRPPVPALRPIPWWLRVPPPGIPILPIMMNPCVLVPDFPGCFSKAPLKSD